MKLEPISKPIRIRIKLGQNEYSTLEEVRDNFSVKELYPLYLDGRLSRWLRQRNETDLADKVDLLQEVHNDESFRDYLYFISIFFTEIENILNQDDTISGSENSFLGELNIEQLCQIYQYTQSIDGINWKDLLIHQLSLSNYKLCLENTIIHSILPNKDGWGLELAKLTRSEADYKEIIIYLEQRVRSIQDYNDILVDYYFSTNNNGFVWADIFKDFSKQELMLWHSNGVFREKCKQDWNQILLADASIEQVITLFENIEFHSQVADWVNIFLSAIKSEEDFVSAFNYLDKYSRSNPQDRNSFKVFIESTEEESYPFHWYNVLGEELTIDDLLYYYSVNPTIPDWGLYFVDKTSDWNTQSAKVIDAIQNDTPLLHSYCQLCYTKGFSAAMCLLDPWYSLANSPECQILMPILKEWRQKKHWADRKVERRASKFKQITSELGQQILEFLNILTKIWSTGKPSKSSFITDDYLNKELQIMSLVIGRSLTYSKTKYFFSPSVLQTINQLDVDLASFLVDNTVVANEMSYLEISNMAVTMIENKLVDNIGEEISE